MKIKPFNLNETVQLLLDLGDNYAAENFTFTFYTGINIAKKYICSRSGDEFVNCSMADDTHVLCVLDQTGLSEGLLKVSRYIEREDSRLADGTYRTGDIRLVVIVGTDDLQYHINMTHGASSSQELTEDTWNVVGAALRGKTGVGIKDIKQTVEATEDGGVNVVQFILDDGTMKEIRIKNGSKGDTTSVEGTGDLTKALADTYYVAQVSGKGLSTNDYTDADKAKLAGVEEGAQVNPTDYVKNNDSRLSDPRTPTAHTHEISDVSGLQTNLDAKASADSLAQLAQKIDNIANESIEPSVYDIPCVYLNGSEFSNMTTEKNEVKMQMTYASKSEKFDAYIKIKYQGNSSLSYPKKNFTIKMYSDSEYSTKLKKAFRGWKKFNKFILKANWIDYTQARNIVSARIWSDVVKSRSDYDTLPQDLKDSPMCGAIDGFLVKVYINGVYRGRYTWNIGKDEVTFGENCEGAICSEDYSSGCFRQLSTFTDSVDWSPEYPDTIADEHKASFNNAIQLCINGDNDAFAENIEKYIDLQSIIDYECFGRVLCHLDGFGKNQIFLNYGNVWFASPYDLDSTFGLYWNGSKIVSTSYVFQDDYETIGSHSASNKLYDLIDANFANRLITRYFELRNGALSETNIINRFEEFLSVCPKELAEEDYASTTGNGAYTDIPSKSITSIQQLRSYIVSRCAYCDSVMKGLVHVATPVITIDESGNATISCATVSATIYYTTDGTEPSTLSTLYTGAFSASEYLVIKAIAIKDGYGDSNISIKYTSTKVIYELPQETTFASKYDVIDTGIQLMKDRSTPFIIFVDFTPNAYGLYNTILHCMLEQNTDTYPGISLQMASNNKLQIGGYTTLVTPIDMTIGVRCKFFIKHDSNDIRYYSTDGKNWTLITATISSGEVTQNMIIGGRKVGTVIDRVANSTLHKLVVINATEMSDDYITELLS